jgi:hypothetical protein
MINTCYVNIGNGVIPISPCGIGGFLCQRPSLVCFCSLRNHTRVVLFLFISGAYRKLIVTLVSALIFNALQWQNHLDQRVWGLLLSRGLLRIQSGVSRSSYKAITSTRQVYRNHRWWLGRGSSNRPLGHETDTLPLHRAPSLSFQLMLGS